MITNPAEEKVNKIEEHVKAIFNLLDLPVTESNKDTPRRVAKMYANELFQHRNNNGIGALNMQMKLFDNPSVGSKTPVVMRGISFTSVCEHHWMPFIGECTVTYVPGSKIIGLSKIPRVVKFFSRKPQLQERLTQEICDYLFDILDPVMVRVEMTAQHCCVMCRGAESDCVTDTVAERWHNKPQR